MYQGGIDIGDFHTQPLSGPSHSDHTRGLRVRDRVRDYFCGEQAQVVDQFLSQGQPEPLRPVDNALSRGWYGRNQRWDCE
jgi:hypothetical protein